jgi:outer membrane protein assembly factor BamD
MGILQAVYPGGYTAFFVNLFLMKPFHRLFWVLLLTPMLLLTGCSDYAKLQKSGTDDQKYKAAVAYYEKKDWYRAGQLFEELIPKLKGSTESEMSQINYAYTQYYQGLYAVSAQLFKRFYETFARSEKAADAQYMYAFSLYKDTPAFNLDQSNTVIATAALQDYINANPDSPHREECTTMILDLRRKLEEKAYERAKLYYKTSAFNIASLKSSVIAINNFQREFPDSQYNEELAFLKVDAQYSLANNSLVTKQKERFQDAITFFTDFKAKYPESKYLKQGERMVETSQKELARLTLEAEELEKARVAAAAATTKTPPANLPAKVGTNN